MRRCCARRPVTHPVKLGFEAVQGGEDTQADAPRISKIKLRPLGSHGNTFGSPAPLAMLQTIVFEARKRIYPLRARHCCRCNSSPFRRGQVPEPANHRHDR